ncbi:2-hydroxyacyl-CoA dehydratase family protein [Clostridium botulinum]|nr:2-hydroxyacyl-CoA dehydratase family protein [Clostridium botulinum]
MEDLCYLKSYGGNNIPYLSIDGDGVDRRNSQDGQLRTRLEAFLKF